MPEIIDNRDHKQRLRRDIVEITTNYLDSCEKMCQTFVDSNLLTEQEAIIVSNDVIGQLGRVSREETDKLLIKLKGE